MMDFSLGSVRFCENTVVSPVMISDLPLRLVLLFLFPTLSHQTSGYFSLKVQSPVSGLLGSSVSLHCALTNQTDVRQMEVRWYRPKMSNTPVLLYKDTQIVKSPVDVQYQDRVSLLGELEKGNVSLKLENLRLADRGEYVCHVTSKNWYDKATVSLSVRVVGSVPVLSSHVAKGGKVNVSCESHGWLPKPSVNWTDNTGKDLKHRSNDKFTNNSEGLVDVSSWLIVSPSESEWISCSVGLSGEEIKDSRIMLVVPPDVTEVSSLYFILIPVPLLLCAVGIAVYCLLRKRGLPCSNRKGTKHTGTPAEMEPLKKCHVENQYELEVVVVDSREEQRKSSSFSSPEISTTGSVTDNPNFTAYSSHPTPAATMSEIQPTAPKLTITTSNFTLTMTTSIPTPTITTSTPTPTITTSIPTPTITTSDPTSTITDLFSTLTITTSDPTPTITTSNSTTTITTLDPTSTITSSIPTPKTNQNSPPVTIPFNNTLPAIISKTLPTATPSNPTRTTTVSDPIPAFSTPNPISTISFLNPIPAVPMSQSTTVPTPVEHISSVSKHSTNNTEKRTSKIKEKNTKDRTKIKEKNWRFPNRDIEGSTEGSCTETCSEFEHHCQREAEVSKGEMDVDEPSSPTQEDDTTSIPTPNTTTSNSTPTITTSNPTPSISTRTVTVPDPIHAFSTPNPISTIPLLNPTPADTMSQDIEGSTEGSCTETCAEFEHHCQRGAEDSKGEMCVEEPSSPTQEDDTTSIPTPNTTTLSSTPTMTTSNPTPSISTPTVTVPDPIHAFSTPNPISTIPLLNPTPADTMSQDIEGSTEGSCTETCSEFEHHCQREAEVSKGEMCVEEPSSPTQEDDTTSIPTPNTTTLSSTPSISTPTVTVPDPIHAFSTPNPISTIPLLNPTPADTMSHDIEGSTEGSCTETCSEFEHHCQRGAEVSEGEMCVEEPSSPTQEDDTTSIPTPNTTTLSSTPTMTTSNPTPSISTPTVTVPDPIPAFSTPNPISTIPLLNPTPADTMSQDIEGSTEGSCTETCAEFEHHCQRGAEDSEGEMDVDEPSSPTQEDKNCKHLNNIDFISQPGEMDVDEPSCPTQEDKNCKHLNNTDFISQSEDDSMEY